MKKLQRVRLRIEGRVQGVGFRPAVYRLARRFSLTGFVNNTGFGVLIEAQGSLRAVAGFIACLQSEKPRQAVIESLLSEEIKPSPSEKDFSITESIRSGDVRAGMPPDLAICNLCRRELFEKNNRRYRYPFINCTDCGPRFTIIRSLPYDRERTSMKSFKMCPECRLEFSAPDNRRFEAQPNACPVCGPSLRLLDSKFAVIAGDPIEEAVKLLRAGKILAVKGIGGYHLCCDALDAATVNLLRRRKNRPHKPFAVMFKSLEQVREYCRVSSVEAGELESVAAPVVILPMKKKSLAANISPDTDDIGAFLPYAPLHCLLLEEISPLVMTSGNQLDEPMAIDEPGLKAILGRIADVALTHDRDIERRADDSVLKFMPGKFTLGRAGQLVPPFGSVGQGCPTLPVEKSPRSAGPNLSNNVKIMLRRSRGFVPSPIRLPLAGPPILACGAELKNTVCVTRQDQAFLSPHIGDLDDLRSYKFFKETVGDFIALLEIKPEVVAYDMHPDYISARFAAGFDGLKKEKIQHHHAHIASCLAEHQLADKVIGIALDGTGYGPDGTIWGGEIMIADLRSFQRVGHFKQYPLPGGEAAILEPARMALSILCAEFGADAGKVIKKFLPAISEQQKTMLMKMANGRLHSPLTSSAGRLFDAVAALLGLGDRVSYEGRAAMRLQALADQALAQNYSYEIQEKNGILMLSFAKTIRGIIADLEEKIAGNRIATMFHNTLTAALMEACGILREREGLNRVVLSGGVFQNDLLLGKLINCLQRQKFAVYTNQLVPPNDGGIALGQAAVAAARNAS